MNKILIIFVSKNMLVNQNKNLLTIKKNLIDTLKDDNTIVDLCSVLSEPNINISSKNILGDFKYEFICTEPQLRKVCYIFNTIKYDEYDWYIKVRPEIYLLEKITHEKLTSFSKEKINARCRGYEGPHINLVQGCSFSNIKIAPPNLIDCYNYIKYNDKHIKINPDDMMYFFHKNIAAQAFAPLYLQTYLDYVEKLKAQIEKPFWFYEWMLLDNYFIKNNHDREGHHQFIWNNRNIFINPINLNLHMRNIQSGKLII